MWANAAVQANRAALEARGVRFLGPATGDQACGETGPGRMLEPNDIAAALLEQLDPSRARPLKGLKVVVTAGPTREPIDPVRYITNRSSGKMGFAVANAARDAGAEVVLVTGPVALPTPAAVRKAQDMGLDLILIAPTAEPPVAKAMDYGQWQYEQKKKQHEAKKKQHVIQVKELKFRPNGPRSRAVAGYARERRRAAARAVHGRLRRRDS